MSNDPPDKDRSATQDCNKKQEGTSQSHADQIAFPLISNPSNHCAKMTDQYSEELQGDGSIEARRKKGRSKRGSGRQSSTGGQGSGRSARSAGTRSFVARRFLENEDDDFEPDRLDLEDDAGTAVGGDLASQSSSRGPGAAGGGSNFFANRDKYSVDQSVNLMDTSAATYVNNDKRRKKHARPRMKKGGMQASMGKNRCRWIVGNSAQI